jgi:hypothetical protein
MLQSACAKKPSFVCVLTARASPPSLIVTWWAVAVSGDDEVTLS